MSISTIRNSGLSPLAMCLSTGLLLSAGLFLSTGKMQAAQQATFHLSVPTHWGQAVLQPGDYSMSLPVPSAGESSLRVIGEGKTILELPLEVERRTNTKSSYIKLAEVDGNYFVREFSSGVAGEVFTFSVPKHLKR